MNTSVFLTILAACIAAVYAWNQNPIVTSPHKGCTFTTGQQIPINWEDAETSHVNIELVNAAHPELLAGAAFSIALGVDATKDAYVWTVPAGLPSGCGYQIRVWGANVPCKNDELGISGAFCLNEQYCPEESSSESSSSTCDSRRHHGHHAKAAYDVDDDLVLEEHLSPEQQITRVEELAKADANRQHQQDLLNVIRQQRLQQQQGIDFVPEPIRQATPKKHHKHDLPGAPSKNAEAPQGELKDTKEAIQILENNKVEEPAKSPEQSGKKEEDKKEKPEDFTKLKPKTDLPKLDVEKMRQQEGKNSKNAKNKKNANAANATQITAGLLVLSVIVAVIPFF